MGQDVTPTVSIIVPIYHVEPYIRQCVYSLIEQSYTDLEIILVDDGSDDGCGAIIDELALEDPRIIVIHQENKGVSAARNAGLKLAQGKYLMFVDGDDYVEPDYVEYFVSMVEESGCDIGVGRNAFSREKDMQLPESPIQTISAEDIIEGIYLNRFGVAVWNKIYRHDIVKESGLRFNTEFWYAEGMLFNIQYLQVADTAAIGKRRVYHVRENPESATRSFKLKNQYCGLRSMEFQKDCWKKTTIGIKTAWEYHYRMYAKHILEGLILSGGKKENLRLFRKCIRILRTHLRIPLQSDLSARMKENSILLAICPTGFIRDEHCTGREKGDQSDFFSRKLLYFARKWFSKIPMGKKEQLFNRICASLRRRYRPVYLEKKLL